MSAPHPRAVQPFRLQHHPAMCKHRTRRKPETMNDKTARTEDGLFSHPDTTQPVVTSITPNDNKPSHVDLFREPADVPEDAKTA